MQHLSSKRPVALGTTSTLLHSRLHLTRQCCRWSRLHVVASFRSQRTKPCSRHEQPQQRGKLQTVAGAVDDYPSYNPQPATDYTYNPQPYNPQSFGTPDSSASLPEAARQSLAKATRAMSRYGWIGFWIQLTLSVVSGVILLFSVAFTSQVIDQQAQQATVTATTAVDSSSTDSASTCCSIGVVCAVTVVLVAPVGWPAPVPHSPRPISACSAPTTYPWLAAVRILRQYVSNRLA
eukprot:GHUV01016325.1.p1 GENE.GHUV01016325.1~~GHUV01016325.1.p1  ORF type:complete len:235 (+),score=30.82 GHUV01016325.1:198-902(+)